MAAPPRRCWAPRPQGLSLMTFNIHNGRGFGLAQSIRVVQINGLEAMLLTENNITYQSYCRNRLVYNVVCFPGITTDSG